MDEQDDASSQAKEAPQAPSAEESQPVGSTPNQPASQADLTEVKEDLAKAEEKMSGFERSTLRWTRASFVIVLATMVFIGLQWNEMRTGSADTHDLAVAAKTQADKMKDMSEAADKIRMAAEGMVAQEKRLADDTENALTASSKQSREALSASIAASRSDQRAWLGTGDWSFSISASDPIKATVIVSNTGRSPATAVICRIGGGTFPRDHVLTDADIAYSDSNSILKDGTVFPNQRFPLSANSTPIQPDAQKAWFHLVENGDQIQYFWGYAIYDDAFGKNHWTHFCSIYRPTTKDGAPCNVYGDTDNTKKYRN